MPYTAEQMFAVANDVGSYSVFLPGCEQSDVLSECGTEMTARLVIAKGAIRKAFTTRNFLEPPRRIKLELVDGPFSAFSGDWHFTSLGDEGCRINIEVDFSFESGLLNLTPGKVLTIVAERLIDAFCQRADQLYGQ